MKWDWGDVGWDFMNLSMGGKYNLYIIKRWLCDSLWKFQVVILNMDKNNKKQNSSLERKIKVQMKE